VIKKQFIYYLIAQTTAALFYYAGMGIVIRKPITLPTTFLDSLVTYHALFAYIYLSFFFLVMMAILGSRVLVSKQCMLTVVLNSSVAFVFFIGFPTQVPEYFYEHAPGMSTPIILWIRQSDRNLNCFPSLHISNALAAVYFFNVRKPTVIKIICWIWFLLITWSVLSTKQHCFYDIAGGMILAAVNLTLVKRFTRKSSEKSVSAPIRITEMGPG
jgi:membrane-associated phospholipid phosphatase